MLTLFLVLLSFGVYGPTPSHASGWSVETRPVTTVARLSGNTPAFWGYHQPIIVRSGSKVYAGLLQPWGEGHDQQWSLFELRGDSWVGIYSSPSSRKLNQPPILLADDQGELHTFAWLDGVCHQVSFGTGSPVETLPDVGYNDLWPYAGGATNADGELLIVPSSYPAHTYGHRALGNDTWQTGTAVEFAPRPESPSNYDRHAYPFVVLSGREAHIFSTQDVNDPEKIAAGVPFTYSFRTLEYYYSPDLLNAPFQTVSVVDVETSKGWAHNDDMMVDQDGNVHILYRYQTSEQTSPTSPLMHAFGPAGGPLTHVAVSSDEWSEEGRLWEAPNGALFVVRVIDGVLSTERLGPDGRRTGSPLSLGISPDSGDYTSSRVFLASARASSQGAPFLEGLYQHQQGGTLWVHYFRASLPELVADVDGNGSVTFGDFLSFADSFGKSVSDPGYSRSADANADGQVDFSDFLEFVAGYQTALE